MKLSNILTLLFNEGLIFEHLHPCFELAHCETIFLFFNFVLIIIVVIILIFIFLIVVIFFDNLFGLFFDLTID